MGEIFITSEIKDAEEHPILFKEIDSIVEGTFYRVKNRRLKSTKEWESYLYNEFGFVGAKSPFSHRGDFLYKKNDFYYEHKGGVLRDSFARKGRRKVYDMLELKFSNVYEKMFVEFIKKEIDLIFEDYNNMSKSSTLSTNINEELMVARYSGEFQRSTLRMIDEYVEECYKFLVKSDYTPKSRCLKNKLDFTEYCDLLCMVNLRMYPNIIVSSNDTYAFFNLTNYRLFVSYIGFGGFKIVFFYDSQTTNTPNGKHKTNVEGGGETDKIRLEGDHKKLIYPNSYLESLRDFCGGEVYPEIIELMKVLYLKDIKSEIKYINMNTYHPVYHFDDAFKKDSVFCNLNDQYNFLTEEIKNFIYNK